MSAGPPRVQAEFPDLLTSESGRPVTSARDWWRVRRPELAELFQRHVYGTVPADPGPSAVRLRFEDPDALGGRATLREFAVELPAGPVMNVLVMVPNQHDGLAPVLAGLNFTGNHSTTDHPAVRVPTAWMPDAPTVTGHRAMPAGRGTSTRWPLAEIAERGYAIATAYYGELRPDDPDVRGGSAPPDTPAVAAWAWGLHRVVDVLAGQSGIDAARIGVVGHSRLGKAALLAAAFDERIALALVGQAGCGGSGPSRTGNPDAETVRAITTRFPHWFSPGFAAFGDRVEQLPVDQHGLVALCAPRPVLFTCATGDQWADPRGQFDVLRAASPAYELLGVGGVAATAYPAENDLLRSRLGFWVRPGRHDVTAPDWDAWLTYADDWL